MIILSFEEFIKESYLKEGKGLLYYWTFNFTKNLSDDMILPKYFSDGRKTIKLSRNSIYGITEHKTDVRICLSGSKLENNYKINSFNLNKKSKLDYTPLEAPINKIGIGDTFNSLKHREPVYEENIDKPITNLGKFIVYIDFPSIEFIKRYADEINNYLILYPHIIIRAYDKKDRYLTTEVETPIVNDLVSIMKNADLYD